MKITESNYKQYANIMTNGDEEIVIMSKVNFDSLITSIKQEERGRLIQKLKYISLQCNVEGELDNYIQSLTEEHVKEEHEKR